MKYLLLLLLLSCGMKHNVKVNDLNVKHEIDLTGIIEFCEDENATEEEIQECQDELIDIIRRGLDATDEG